MIRPLALFLLAIFAPAIAVSGQSELIGCTATSANHVGHTLELKTESGAITGFSYASVSPTGDTCEISAKKGDKDSKWEQQQQGTVVDTYALGQESGRVLIARVNNSFKIRVLSELGKSCGLKGYLAPVAIVHIGKKKCELLDDNKPEQKK